MFRSLARNLFITGVAYSVVSLVGLVLAPFLIGRYGLGGYGQILLARLALPTATFGFLDLGIGETATRTVAEANRTKEWDKAGRTLSLLLVVALVVSTGLSLLIAALAAPLPGWLAIAPDQRAGFTSVLLLTAALEPLLFLSMLAEGVLKGLEQFKRARTCEVASALVYGGVGVALGVSGHGPNWIAVALLAGLAVRALMAIGSALLLLKREHVTSQRWCAETRSEVFAWSRLMLYNKVLGTVQTQVAPPLIGLLIGPAAVGAFDAVTRLPRFAKSIFGLLSTTVLPLAAGLKAAADHGALRRLGSYGTLSAMLITIPALVFAAVYSRSLMEFWIGDAAVEFWGWQSAMFLIPIFNQAIGFGGTMLLADRAASHRLMRLTLCQVTLQLILSLALMPMLGPWSFVIGQVLSVALLFRFQLAVLHKSLGLSRLPLQFTVLVAISGVLAAGLVLLEPAPKAAALVLLGVAHSAAAIAAAAALLLTRSERAQLWMMLQGWRHG